MSCSGRLLYLIALNFITAIKTHTDLMNFAIYRFFFLQLFILALQLEIYKCLCPWLHLPPLPVQHWPSRICKFLKRKQVIVLVLLNLDPVGKRPHPHWSAPRIWLFGMTQKKVHRLTEGGRCRRTCSCVRTLLCFVSTCAGKWSCSQARQITHHTVLTGLIYMACVRHESSHFEEVFRRRRGFCQTVLL